VVDLAVVDLEVGAGAEASAASVEAPLAAVAPVAVGNFVLLRA
jgi:hypothetical protein